MTFYNKTIIDNDILMYYCMDSDNIYTLAFNENTQKLPKRFLYEVKNTNNGSLSITLFLGSGGFVVPQTLPPYIGIIDRQKIFNCGCIYTSQDLLNTYKEIKKFLRGEKCVINEIPISGYEETKPVCNHQWVNYGFTSLSFCCKLCGMEKPT